jgi:hypothetical protein
MFSFAMLPRNIESDRVNNRTRRTRVNKRVHRSIHITQLQKTYPLGYYAEADDYEILLAHFDLFIDHLLIDALGAVALTIWCHDHLLLGDAVLVAGDRLCLDQTRRASLDRVKTLALCLSRTCLSQDTRRLIVAAAISSANDVRYVESHVAMTVPSDVGTLCADEITCVRHENEFGAFITFYGKMEFVDVKEYPLIHMTTPPSRLVPLLQKACENYLVCIILLMNLIARAYCASI